MSEAKKAVREAFRNACLKRDHSRCRICGVPVSGIDVNVHHITPREEMPHGGYVEENGITCCPACHERAEAALKNRDELHVAVPLGFFHALSRASLYMMISSSHADAFAASKRLK